MSNQDKGVVTKFGYRLPRFPADFRLLVQTTEPEPKLLEARCRDISEDGLAAQIGDCLPVGTRVFLLLTLPGKATALQIAATVGHQDGGDHGFAFNFESQNQREQVQKYVISLRNGSFALHRSPK